MALTGLVAANNLGDVVDIEKTWDNIGNNISATVFVPSPTLDLNFAGNKSLVDNVSGQNLITFSRASTGTFVGSNGLIQTAASGVPRFGHNGATGESLGLLVEEAKTNNCWYSNFQQFVGAGSQGWNPLVGATATQNAAVAPDNTNTALLMQEDSSNGSHSIKWVGSNPTATLTASIFVKSAGVTTVSLGIFNGTSATFNLTNLTATPSIGTALIQALPNGWYRISVTTDGVVGSQNYGNFTFSLGSGNYQGNGTSGVYIWGAQYEGGSLTSHIPTSGATATRAADAASITGTNFSSWYNQNESTLISQFRILGKGNVGASSIYNGLWSLTPNTSFTFQGFVSNGSTYYVETNNGPYFGVGGVVINQLYKGVVALKSSMYAISGNGSTPSTSATTIPSLSATGIHIGRADGAGPNYLNGHYSRLTYYPIRLSNITLQALSSSGPVLSFLYSFSIKGRDILALKEVNKTSTRDFIFTKGLLSRAQPRITTASQYTSSGVALRDAAMLKFAPVTRGNYFFSSGLTLSGATVQINGTNARSIATSPFSSSTATVPLLFAGLRPQTNWRISETMASGVVASPESAIPIETGDFLLFMKAGQS